VRLSPEIPSLIAQERVPFLGEMGGYRIMLLEFPHGHIPPGADKMVARRLQMKVRPVIAHPERNKDVMRDIDRIRPFVEMGCILQLTAASVCGRFGERAHRAALHLLQLDADKIIATDAHDLAARPPLMQEGVDAVSELIGAEAAAVMSHSLPLRIVASQFRSAGAGNAASAAPAARAAGLQAGISPRASPAKAVRGSGAGRPAAPAQDATAATSSLDDLLLRLLDQRVAQALALPSAEADASAADKLASRYHRELLRQLRRSPGTPAPATDAPDARRESSATDAQANSPATPGVAAQRIKFPLKP